PEPAAEHWRVTEAVEQREPDRSRERLRCDPVEGVVEVVRLDRHHEQPDGRLEPLDGPGLWHRGPLSVDERESRGLNRPHGPLRADAEGACAHCHHAADATHPEHGDRPRHVRAGSTTRVTYLVSE